MNSFSRMFHILLLLATHHHGINRLFRIWASSPCTSQAHSGTTSTRWDFPYTVTMQPLCSQAPSDTDVFVTYCMCVLKEHCMDVKLCWRCVSSSVDSRRKDCSSDPSCHHWGARRSKRENCGGSSDSATRSSDAGLYAEQVRKQYWFNCSTMLCLSSAPWHLEHEIKDVCTSVNKFDKWISLHLFENLIIQQYINCLLVFLLTIKNVCITFIFQTIQLYDWK